MQAPKECRMRSEIKAHLNPTDVPTTLVGQTMPDLHYLAKQKRVIENPVNAPQTSISDYPDVTSALSDSQEQVMNNEAKILFPLRKVKLSCSTAEAIEAPKVMFCGFKRLIKNFEKMVNR